MIIDDRLLKEEYIPGTDFKKLTCIITKDEFLECYNAWVKPTDTVRPKVDTHAKCWDTVGSVDVLRGLPQYHFDRDVFVSTFEQVFTEAEIDSIEAMCQQHTALNEFFTFLSSGLGRILHYLSSKRNDH